MLTFAKIIGITYKYSIKVQILSFFLVSSCSDKSFQVGHMKTHHISSWYILTYPYVYEKWNVICRLYICHIQHLHHTYGYLFCIYVSYSAKPVYSLDCCSLHETMCIIYLLRWLYRFTYTMHTGSWFVWLSTVERTTYYSH